MNLSFRAITVTKYVAALGVVGMLAGCISATESNSTSRTSCEITDINYQEAAEKCERGQRLVFLPDTWGNGQLPITAAHAFCDPHQPIVHNEAGVSCIFDPIDLESGDAEIVD